MRVHVGWVFLVAIIFLILGIAACCGTFFYMKEVSFSLVMEHSLGDLAMDDYILTGLQENDCSSVAEKVSFMKESHIEMLRVGKSEAENGYFLFVNESRIQKANAYLEQAGL